MDYNAKLKGRYDLSSVDNFNPLEILKYFVCIRGGKTAWNEHEQALKERVYEKLKQKTQSGYNAIKVLNEPLTYRHIDIVRNMAEYIENWQKCYDFKKIPYFLNVAIEELTGEGKLQWFATSQSGLVRFPVFQKITYNPRKRLEEFTQLFNKNTFDENCQIAGKNLFDKLIKPRYDYLKFQLSSHPRQIERFREEIYLLMCATSHLYRSVQKLDVYRDTFFEEFICENIASWFVHKVRRISANEQSRGLAPIKN